MQCEVLLWDLASPYPAPLAPWKVGEAKPAEVDWSDIDCEGVGVTITNSSWDFIDRAVDDPTNIIVLGTPGITGLLTFVLVSAGVDAMDVRLVNEITTSDGRTLRAAVNVPWREFLRWP